MLDLRRRMGMDPWHRREKSAGKPDIQVIISRPGIYVVCDVQTSKEHCMIYKKRFKCNIYLCLHVCIVKSYYILGSRRSS